MTSPQKELPPAPPPPGWRHWCKRFIAQTIATNACARCGRIESWHKAD